MKFELCSNDSEPFVEVVKESDELVVKFWGFGSEEAKSWFNSEAVMESLESWHSSLGDFEMRYKQIKWKEM